MARQTLKVQQRHHVAEQSLAAHVTAENTCNVVEVCGSAVVVCMHCWCEVYWRQLAQAVAAWLIYMHASFEAGNHISHDAMYTL